MENGRTEQIIEKLVDMVENGQSMPLSAGKVVINKDEAILMIRELENIVKGELKIYREVTDRRGKIINDAKKEAEDIIYEADRQRAASALQRGCLQLVLRSEPEIWMARRKLL